MPFASAKLAATSGIFEIFAEPISVDGLPGTGVVYLDTNLTLGGSIQVVNGAHLLVRAVDFPDIVQNNEVEYDDITYIICDPVDDIDEAGCRRARMVRL